MRNVIRLKPTNENGKPVPPSSFPIAGHHPGFRLEIPRLRHACHAFRCAYIAALGHDRQDARTHRWGVWWTPFGHSYLGIHAFSVVIAFYDCGQLVDED